MSFLLTQQANFAEVTEVAKRADQVIQDRTARGEDWVPMTRRQAFYMTICNRVIAASDREYCQWLNQRLIAEAARQPASPENLSYRTQLFAASAMMSKILGNEERARERYRKALAISEGSKVENVLATRYYAIQLMIDDHLIDSQEAVRYMKEAYEHYYAGRLTGEASFIGVSGHYGAALEWARDYENAAKVFLEEAQAAHTSAVKNPDKQNASWSYSTEFGSLCACARQLKALGRIDEARATLTEAESLLPHVVDAQRTNLQRYLSEQQKLLTKT